MNRKKIKKVSCHKLWFSIHDISFFQILANVLFKADVTCHNIEKLYLNPDISHKILFIILSFLSIHEEGWDKLENGLI